MFAVEKDNKTVLTITQNTKFIGKKIITISAKNPYLGPKLQCFLKVKDDLG